MTALRIWVMAARPKTWIAGISPVLLGTSLAFAEGHLRPLLFFFTLLSSLGIQITTNLANDYFDFLKGADTPDRKGPTRVTGSGLVSVSRIKKAVILSLGITALLGSYLAIQGGPVLSALILLSCTLAILYTGGPYPLAYLGLGDVFVLVFFGPVAVAGTYFLQTHQISFTAAFIGLGAGALSTALLVINNLRDIEEDSKANKKTLIVRFGTRFGQIEYLLCLLCASMIPFFFIRVHPYSLLSLLFLIPAFPCIKEIWKKEEEKPFHVLLPKTGRLLLLYTFFFCVGWIL